MFKKLSSYVVDYITITKLHIKEVFDLKEEGGKPTSRTVLDYPTNTITWLNESTIIIVDERGNLIRLSGIGSKEVQLNLMETKFKRLRQLKAFESKFLAAIMHDEGEGKLVLWTTDSIVEAKDLERPKPALVLKLNVGRLTSLNVQRASLKRKRSKAKDEENEESVKPTKVSVKR